VISAALSFQFAFTGISGQSLMIEAGPKWAIGWPFGWQGRHSLRPQRIHFDRVQTQSLGEASLQLSFDNLQTSFTKQVAKLLI
jgi:hypothetical protein